MLLGPPCGFKKTLNDHFLSAPDIWNFRLLTAIGDFSNLSASGGSFGLISAFFRCSLRSMFELLKPGTKKHVAGVKPVGGFNPFEKYDRQIGSFPQVGLKLKNSWNHHKDQCSG